MSKYVNVRKAAGGEVVMKDRGAKWGAGRAWIFMLTIKTASLRAWQRVIW